MMDVFGIIAFSINEWVVCLLHRVQKVDQAVVSFRHLEEARNGFYLEILPMSKNGSVPSHTKAFALY